MKPARSIRRELVVWMSAGLLAAIAVAAVATYLRAREEALIEHRQHQPRFDQRELKANAAPHADAKWVIGIGVARRHGFGQKAVRIEPLAICAPVARVAMQRR